MAAAAAAEDAGPPPQELVWAWQARAWGTLPRAGGLGDQVVGVLERMTAAENVYRAVQSWRAAPNWAQWARQNPHEWRVVQEVMRLRQAAGGDDA